VPYPASCRPQAWAAAGALLLLRTLIGVDARLPDGRVTLRPLAPAPFDRLDVDGLPLAGGLLDVRLRDGELTAHPHGLAAEVAVEQP